jgi:succinyl-CoA synthetase beta subunit
MMAGLRAAGALRLGMPELAPVLAECGIAVAAPVAAKSEEEAGAAAARVGFPVALKIVSPDITHKTEVGGVVLDLHDARAVREAAALVLSRVAAARPQAVLRGVLVEPMAPAGKELLLGGVRDPQFGPLVMVGSGGIYVEIFADTAARLAPVSPAEALEMLDELKIAPLLRGVRGERPVDRAALSGIVGRFAQLLVDLPDVDEIEINPLMAGPDGAMAVDARARLSP